MLDIIIIQLVELHFIIINHIQAIKTKKNHFLWEVNISHDVQHHGDAIIPIFDYIYT